MTVTVRGRSGNLPLELSSFVGRRRELSEAKRLLSASRLVTLTGVGGVGKTRLALRTADEVRRAFGDGVWLIELGQLHDAALIGHTVAATLGLGEQPGRSTVASLTEYLATRRLLLVLDNCEHLVDASAALVEAILQAGPDLRVLATSREPLGIRGEATLLVPSLTVPRPDQRRSWRDLSAYEAVTLFSDRGAAVLTGFEVTTGNQDAVVEICNRLDGLPLAIELAAVGLRALSPQQIARRLSDRYELLTTALRGAPTRQQTLRSCIEWSYDLCSASERLLWARASVFAGGFELDAAEQICVDGSLTPGDLLEVVAALVGKSILIRDEHHGVVRYRLLETMREFGQDRLGPEQHAAIRRRHRDWYEQLVVRADDDWVSPRQVGWFARLDREHANVRMALEYCLTSPVRPTRPCGCWWPCFTSTGGPGPGAVRAGTGSTRPSRCPPGRRRSAPARCSSTARWRWRTAISAPQRPGRRRPARSPNSWGTPPAGRCAGTWSEAPRCTAATSPRRPGSAVRRWRRCPRERTCPCASTCSSCSRSPLAWAATWSRRCSGTRRC